MFIGTPRDGDFQDTLAQENYAHGGLFDDGELCNEDAPLFPDDDKKKITYGLDGGFEPERSLPQSSGAVSVFVMMRRLGNATSSVVLSLTLLAMNRYLTHEHRFPYPIAVGAFQALCTCVCMAIVYLATPRLFPAMCFIWKGSIKDKIASYTPFLTLGILSAINLVCSITAYRQASPAFVIATNTLDVLVVYVLMATTGLERMQIRFAAVLSYTVFSVLPAASNLLTFTRAGAVLQLVSCLLRSAQTVGINSLMAREDAPPLDPFSSVLLTAPVVFGTLAPSLLLPGLEPMQTLLQKGYEWRTHLAASACLACSAQVAAATLIHQTSALGLALANVPNIVYLVAFTGVVLRVPISWMQICGCGGAVLGLVIYIIMKLTPEKFEVPAEQPHDSEW